ncbi:MAG TPA: hypothetical protein VFU39_09565 [Sulfuricaulis sp.]|nr:hypothetical protein [Sulfuricaulis sp.]
MDSERTTKRTGTMEMCPMASMCKGMAGKPRFGLLLLIPGLLLLVAGVLIFIEPKVLVWLVAGASILMGVVMLFVATVVMKMSGR